MASVAHSERIIVTKVVGDANPTTTTAIPTANIDLLANSSIEVVGGATTR